MSPTIDRSALESILDATGGDPEFLAEMIDEFLADSPQLLAAMRAALASGNAAELRRAAHSLKSNSSNFGAHALAELCRELEERGKAGALDGASELFSQIEAEYQLVEPALLAERPTG
jgi:HPt (histidine-containing phosphotransfer) domain-containing protein